MDLDAKTRLGPLLLAHPHLLDFLADYHPRFALLRNPVTRKLLGNAATLAQVAKIGGVPLERLTADLSAELAKETAAKASSAGGRPAAAALLTGDARRAALKEIIADLHRGADPDGVKRRFAALIGDVGAGEIATMEQELVGEGLAPEEIKRLCEVHVAVLSQGLTAPPADAVPGHPVHTYRRENDALAKVIDDVRVILGDIGRPPDPKKFDGGRAELGAALARLGEVEKHYLRKENQLFPFLEKRGVTAPPKVMWAVHDDIRAAYKKVKRAFDDGDAATLAAEVPDLLTAISDMFYKEEKILFPMALETLTAEDWLEARAGEGEIGYALVAAPPPWPAGPPAEAAAPSAPGPGGVVTLNLDTGALTPEQVNLILTHLPLDVTFVDENDVVRYYSATPERVFPRSPGVIGRQVQNCHPPASFDVVNRILNEFRSGTKDVAAFWFSRGEQFIFIAYYAVRDAGGRYRGTLEVSHDVAGLRALNGERRLLDW